MPLDLPRPPPEQNQDPQHNHRNDQQHTHYLQQVEAQLLHFFSPVSADPNFSGHEARFGLVWNRMAFGGVRKQSVRGYVCKCLLEQLFSCALSYLLFFFFLGFVCYQLVSVLAL